MIRRKSETSATAPAPMTAAEQLRVLDEQTQTMATQRAALAQQAAEERLAEQRKEIRSRIEITRAAAATILMRKREVEAELETLLGRVQALAAEANRSTTETADLVEQTIIAVRQLGGNDAEIDGLRGALAAAASTSRTAFTVFHSNKRRWTEAVTVDLCEKIGGSLEQFKAANQLVLIIEKPNQ